MRSASVPSRPKSKTSNSKTVFVTLLTSVFGAVIGLSFYLVSPARADQAIAASYIPQAELVGKARYRYLAWSVFDAHLYAPSGNYSPDKPFALTLTYLRNLNGRDIAKYSADEMREQDAGNNAKLADWESKMAEIFPNVRRNSQITGVRTDDGHTLFYSSGRVIGEIKDQAFTRAFFNIWLGRETSDPSFRRSLIGS